MVRTWDPYPTSPTSTRATTDNHGSGRNFGSSPPQLPDSKTTEKKKQQGKNGGGSDSDLSSDSSEESGLDDREAGTMARFVPTLVLERLRVVGETLMAKKMAGPGSGAENGTESAGGGRAAAVHLANVPQVMGGSGH